MFWNISRIYIYFFSIQNIIFVNFFPIIFFWWKVYSLPLMFIYKRFNFCYSLWMFFYFFIVQSDGYSVLKTSIIFFIDRIYCCFFYFLPNKENLYDPLRLKLILWHNAITEHNQRQTYYLSSILNYFDIYF